MKRRAPRLQTKPHSAPPAPAANPSRALVRVDGSGIRKKIKKDHEKALRELENSRRQLDQFRQADRPQYTRWLNTHFGAWLTEQRELDQKIAADEKFVFQVENEAMFGRCSDARAYQRVMNHRENPEPRQPQPGDGDEANGERDPFEPRHEHGGGDNDSDLHNNDRDEDDPMREFMDEFFRQFELGAGPQGHDGAWAGPNRRAAAPPPTSARLKELYRAVVRRLHPDHQREMTAQKTEWWHQAQAAYEAGDVEQLEVILTLCEIGESGASVHTSASLLQRITAQLKHSLREIKRQIGGQRRDPAWNFSRRTDHDALAVQTRRALTADLERMRDQYRTLQEMIARWKAAAERLNQPRRRKKQPPNLEFPF